MVLYHLIPRDKMETGAVLAKQLKINHEKESENVLDV